MAQRRDHTVLGQSSGQDLIEYALLVRSTSVLLVGGVPSIGTRVTTM